MPEKSIVKIAIFMYGSCFDYGIIGRASVAAVRVVNKSDIS